MTNEEKIICDYFVARIFDNAEDHGLDEESLLLEWGILNSLQILSLVDFLENQFSIKIKPEDLRPENLATITAIAKMVRGCSK